VRTLPSRSLDVEADREIRIDQLRSSPEHPGFQMLSEAPPRELVVGAIGKVWHLDIPFVHVSSAEEFRAFREPDFVNVAWALRVVPRGEHCCRVEFEIYVDATDHEAWRKFRRYFRLIGPGSQFIRQSLLSALAHVADRAAALGARGRGRRAPAARRRARLGAALELDPRRRNRGACGVGVALARPDRRRPRRVLQLPVAREPG
jgi:hypothetical protein